MSHAVRKGSPNGSGTPGLELWSLFLSIYSTSPMSQPTAWVEVRGFALCPSSLYVLVTFFFDLLTRSFLHVSFLGVGAHRPQSGGINL